MNRPDRSITALCLGIAATLGTAATAQAQPQQRLELPRTSPNASVTQIFGVTSVTVHYSRPGVKGRVIWGKLVPYGEVWRTGANENTTISFSTPVRIDGKELPAGIYGLQTIPGQDDWTVILSKDADQWGAFTYKPEHDALRFHAKPEPAELQEWMGFEFAGLSDTSAQVVLRWEKLRLAFRVEAETPKLITAAARGELRWQDQAAGWCVQANACLDDAARWLDASIAVGATFGNLRSKALLLARQNDFAGAVKVGERALAAAKSAAQPPPPAQLADFEKQVAEWKKK
ncbi:MAG TPA: DUF2911 domain-containing protein [Thermoanaerobaculia bacterium]|nr:DUF2911 domain-containing protein [Thermoanaerobaculia bacterium]